MTAGTRPSAITMIMPASTAIACLAPRPNGTAWRRMTSGEYDKNVGVVQTLVEGLPGALKQQRVSGSEHGLPSLIFAASLNGEYNEIAAGRHHPWKKRFPDQGGSRGNHKLSETGCPVE